ncbi:arginine deiminase family protein [Hoeflea sp. AS60]|uniref:arginine deiminase family protein n=1 Tax=Hoeflea sp. AS60 TaxID=3135780 RepID=UPI00317FCA86
MVKAGTAISVIDDIGVLKEALVQGPFCNPLGETTGLAEDESQEAAQQHGRLVRELETAGVTVRHLDAQLYSALGFADARDWILERRISELKGDQSGSCDIISWLSEQPAQALTGYLMDGMYDADLPAGLARPHEGATQDDGWFIAPLANVANLGGWFCVIGGGVLLSQPELQQSRAAAITAGAVLNFAPMFDQSRFEFWLTADGAERSCPPLDVNDIAMPGERVCVAAITKGTSVRALSLLAESLFRENKAGTMLWLDLTGTDCACLDDCFLPLSRECLLVDMKLLKTVNSFVVRANHRGAVLAIEACRTSFVDELARSMGTADLVLIDMKRQPEPVADALTRLAPIVLSPGRIIAFEEHAAAFRLLEQHGVEIVSTFPGAAVSGQGKGPRGLMTALHAT